MDKWQAKVAVITGANSGNGFAILAQLAQEGMIVVGLDLQTDQIEVIFNIFASRINLLKYLVLETQTRKRKSKNIL